MGPFCIIGSLPAFLWPASGDASAWPSSASQLADAKAESTSFLFSTPPGLKPDWRDGDKIDETAFDVTQALRHDLEKEMGPATAGALLAGIEQQIVSQALLECE